MSSAGFTGKTHLLSSERSANINQSAALVKRFFAFLAAFPARKKDFPAAAAGPGGRAAEKDKIIIDYFLAFYREEYTNANCRSDTDQQYNYKLYI